MLHDPNTFEKPFEFIPERYLDSDGNLDPSVPDAEMGGFGFGRRICPGRHFGKDTIFLFAASVLATFNIAQPKDEEGNRVPLDLELHQALIAWVLFTYHLHPSSSHFVPANRPPSNVKSLRGMGTSIWSSRT